MTAHPHDGQEQHQEPEDFQQHCLDTETHTPVRNPDEKA